MVQLGCYQNVTLKKYLDGIVSLNELTVTQWSTTLTSIMTLSLRMNSTSVCSSSHTASCWSFCFLVSSCTQEASMHWCRCVLIQPLSHSWFGFIQGGFMCYLPYKSSKFHFLCNVNTVLVKSLIFWAYRILVYRGAWMHIYFHLHTCVYMYAWK